MDPFATWVAVDLIFGTVCANLEERPIIKKMNWLACIVFGNGLTISNAIKFEWSACREETDFTPVAIHLDVLGTACAVVYNLGIVGGFLGLVEGSAECFVRSARAGMPCKWQIM